MASTPSAWCSTARRRCFRSASRKSRVTASSRSSPWCGRDRRSQNHQQRKETDMQIISANERLAEQRGVKALIVGPAGVGKTSLLRTLDSNRTLFIDIEAGDLSVQNVLVDTVRID